MKRAAQLAALLTTLGAASASAQVPLLEFPEGPIVGSNRLIGLGGAYTGVAEGADGHFYNPSSFAYRYRFTGNQDVDWDWTFYSLTVPGKQNPDLYAPAGTTDGTSFAGGAIDLKIHAFGFGVHTYFQEYLLTRSGDTDSEVFVNNSQGGIGAAFVVTNIDLRVGAFFTAFNWDVTEALPDENNPDRRIDGAELISVSGVGTRLGALWQPTGRPLRIGVAIRPPITTNIQDVSDSAAFPVPPKVYQPGQLTLGASVQLWEREYNPFKTWGLKRFERLEPNFEVNESRRYVLLALDLVATGESPGAISIREYFRNVAAPAGQRTTYAIRAGVESELISNWLQLRAGGYSEPARTNIVSTRIHGTGGFSFRIPIGGLVGIWPWDLRADFGIDLARKFRNIGFGLGLWH